MSLIMTKVVKIICIKFNSMMSWPTREIMQIVMTMCKEWWGLPNVNGAIDKTHINIAKLTLYPKDYFYHKASGYNMVA